MVRISVDLPDEVAERLRQAAGEMQSSPERLLAEAAEAMLADRDAFEVAIAEGEADLAAGRMTSREDVMREMQGWAAALRARVAAEGEACLVAGGATASARGTRLHRRGRPDAADRLIALIATRADMLQRFPMAGRALAADRRAFELPPTRYSLNYRTMPDRVVILAVWHGARAWR